MDIENDIKSVKIFLVENSYQDVRLIKEAFKETGYKYNIHTITYGEDALYLLDQQEKYPEKQDIDLVLLDLGLNDIDGFEILKKIKNSPVLKTMPVVILTSSNNPEDIDHARNCGADKYIVKPCNFEECVNALKEAMVLCKFKMK